MSVIPAIREKALEAKREAKREYKTAQTQLAAARVGAYEQVRQQEREARSELEVQRQETLQQLRTQVNKIQRLRDIPKLVGRIPKGKTLSAESIAEIKRSVDDYIDDLGKAVKEANAEVNKWSKEQQANLKDYLKTSYAEIDEWEKKTINKYVNELAKAAQRAQEAAEVVKETTTVAKVSEEDKALAAAAALLPKRIDSVVYSRLAKGAASFYTRTEDGDYILDLGNREIRYKVMEAYGPSAPSIDIPKEFMPDADFEKLVKDAEINVDAQEKLLDYAEKHPTDLRLLTGTNWKDSVSAYEFNVKIPDVSKGIKGIYRSITPWREELGEKATTAGIFQMYGKGLTVAAEMIVPFVYSAKNWSKLSPAEKSVSFVLDIASIIPGVAMLSSEVRAGTKLSRAIGKVLLAEVKAPITAITHPVSTVKAGVSPFTTLIKPSRIPVAASEIRSYILKIPVEAIGDAKTAMEARDMLTKAAIHGLEPTVEIAGKKIELSKVALQTIQHPVAVHTGYDMRPFLHGSTIKIGAEGKGLFVAPTLNTRLTKASAFGAGLTPAPEVGTFEWTGRHIRKIGKYLPEDVARLDLAPIKPLNLADAENIPAKLAPKLETYIRKNDGVILGSFAEWLKVDNVPRPHDIDLNFANPQKARRDIIEICKSLGYETQLKESAILIKHEGRWIEIANVKGPRSSFFKQHGIELIPASKIDGIQVIPLGEQYLRQGFGAIGAAGKDIATYKKRVEHMLSTSPKLTKLIKQLGIGEKMPGALLIRDKTILAQLEKSGKLYGKAAEIEEIVKAGIKLPEPSQILQSIDSAGNPIHLLVIGNPFTPTEIARLKFLGAVDTVRDIFRPAMKIDNKAVKLTNELDDLATEARRLEAEITRLSKQGKAADAVGLKRELAGINRRAKDVARRIDQSVAGGTSLRMALIATDEPIENTAYRYIARNDPERLASYARQRPEAERERILNTLEPRLRENVDRYTVEISRTSTTERPPTDIPDRIPPPRPPREMPPRTGIGTPRITTTTTRIPPPRIPPPPPTKITPPVPPKEKGVDDLSKEELKGSVQWRQGLFWILKYPPYKQENTLYTRNPVEGVTKVAGLKSAYKTIERLGKYVPEEILHDMGIMDVAISKRGKKIRFRQDLKQKTKLGYARGEPTLTILRSK